MIRLKKVKLINWMYFQNVTINTNGNTVFAGVNGSGKSTIIDAIQMLMLGNRASKFNSNASAEKRTLESYVRGAVTTEDKPFLRPDDVITYLAMEIMRDDKICIFGIYMDFKKFAGKLSDPKYFYFENMGISEELFIKDKLPKSYDDFNKGLKNKNNQFINFPSLFQYQVKIKDVFGLKDEKKYFQILSRAIGIKNIDDCNTFIYNFILEENPIDVKSLKSNIIEIEQLSGLIKSEKDKLKALTDVVEIGDLIEANEKLLKQYNSKLIQTKIIYYKKEIAKLTEENESIGNQITYEENSKNLCSTQLDNLKEEKSELSRLLDEISPDLRTKQNTLEHKQTQLDEAKLNCNTLNTKINHELGNIKRLTQLNNKAINDFYIFLKANAFNTADTKKEFIKYRNEMTLMSTNYNNLIHDNKLEIDKTSNLIRELMAEKQNLEKNKSNFNPEILNFIEYLKKGLADKFNTDVEVKLLCEYLDITDNTWRNAIEGYLGNQRFHIVVPPEYYAHAIKLYHNKKDFYKTNIIDTTRIPNAEIREGSLSQFIISSNNSALNYVRYLLNRVTCVESIDDLNKHDISITKDCMRYQGYSVGRINPVLYKYQFIGLEGINKTLKEKKQELEVVSQKDIQLFERHNALIQKKRQIDYTYDFVQKIIEDNKLIDSLDIENELINEIQELDKSIEFYLSNPKFIEIQAKIAEKLTYIAAKEGQVKILDSKIISLNSALNDNIKEISKANDIITELNLSLQNLDQMTNILISQELDSKDINPKFITNLEEIMKGIDRKLLSLIPSIEYKMKEINYSFTFPYPPSFESLSKYKEEKDKIDVGIFKYEAKFSDFKNKSEALFFTKFLGNLSSSITKAYKTVTNLNHELSLYSFGTDWYDIEASITQNKDLETIYKYAKTYSEDESKRTLLNYETQDPEKDKVQNLLNKYLFSNDIILREKVVDYRNYLEFDIRIHTLNGIKSFNKVIKVQSGGEVQVPFYILSAVAFQQTLDYKRNKDALGIVLYDEAFDKMDSQRILSMLQFYNQLNIQLLIAMPGKLESVVDNMETINAVYREGECAMIGDVTHELQRRNS